MYFMFLCNKCDVILIKILLLVLENLIKYHIRVILLDTVPYLDTFGFNCATSYTYISVKINNKKEQ